MYKSGYSLHDIVQVTKHKNIESLKYYLQQPTLEDMENYSDSLFKYTSNLPVMPTRTTTMTTIVIFKKGYCELWTPKLLFSSQAC